MEHIPNELLTEICIYLDHEDLCKLPFHIISRAFSSKDVKRRWRHVYITLEKSKLQSLVRIAAKPGLREMVTKITMVTQIPKLVEPEDFLMNTWKEHLMRALLSPSAVQSLQHLSEALTLTKPGSVDFDNFHSTLGQDESNCHYCRNVSLVAQFDRCTSRFRAWRTWHDKNQDVSLLKVAFALLPNLKSVRVEDEVKLEKVCFVNDPPFFFTQRYRQLAYTFSGSNFLERTAKAASDSHVMKHSARNMRNSRPSIYGGNVMYLMLGDLVLTVAVNSIHEALKNKVERLELTDVFTTQSGLFHRGTINISSIDACIPIIISHSHLPYLVRVPKDLQTLKIHIWNSNSFAYRGLETPLSVRAPFSPRFFALSALDLEGFVIQERHMERFLACAASTLKSLRLCSIILTRGTWVSLFDRIGGWFDLDNLRLGDLKNCGEEVTEMTGSPIPVILVLTQMAMVNLFDWMCGATDVHYTRVLMCNIMHCNIEEEIRHRDSLLASP